MAGMASQNVKLVDFWGNAKSYVWKHFGFYKNVEDNIIEKGSAVCRTCFKKYAYKGKYF